MNKPTALVIGAGIGGIATAARLAKNGYDVTVLEKESTPGGRANQIVRDGQERGLFRLQIDSFVAMWSFFGALDELAMQWVLSRKQDRFSLEAAADQVAETFIRGMLVDDPTVRSQILEAT